MSDNLNDFFNRTDFTETQRMLVDALRDSYLSVEGVIRTILGDYPDLIRVVNQIESNRRYDDNERIHVVMYSKRTGDQVMRFSSFKGSLNPKKMCIWRRLGENPIIEIPVEEDHVPNEAIAELRTAIKSDSANLNFF